MRARASARPETGGQVTIKKGPIVVLLIMLLAIAVTELTPRVRKYVLERQKQSTIQDTSDAGELKKTITIAGDPWSGYFVFRSEKFRNLLMTSKVRTVYKTEEDLAKRFEGLAKGDWDMAVATVDGYTLGGLKSEYPGVIVWVVDESFGGDAIVGGAKVQTIDDLDALADLARVAFAEGYPSEHLLSAMLTQFKKKVKPVPVKSSREAYELLKAGKVEAAVLWEPETSNAAKEIKGSRVLISTKDMVEFIVDVAIASRRLIAQDPDLVEEVMRAYFATLKYYQKDPARMVEAIAKDAGVPSDTAEKIQHGIRFVNLPDNAFHWFGVGGPDATEKMSRIITETVEIQRAQARLTANPLKDPFAILNRSILERAMKGEEGPLAKKFATPVKPPEPGPRESFAYRPVAPGDWEKADKVGTLDVAPIYFAAGSTELAPEDRAHIDDVARKMSHYPRLRLRVVGHTSPGGDAAAAQALSEERARVVGEYLTRAHSVPPARMQVSGKGGSVPLPRGPGESTRGHQSRCQRVEFILVSLEP
jgi:outer membrane protein OmpA-like peptidoglycan-associated protein/ABC-type amino acid transport substrate-binding protein